ncbi:perlucin-like isoform X1 [Ruditapes philippinarum]|uniref:perlucin-like isoform X1 n=1 Tax=Ruditapes philippinarum TaxID=129788 RepID=UPI00295B487E|nr:perlucin-like isoform X1 [Ruditapes philippinarum]
MKTWLFYAMMMILKVVSHGQQCECPASQCPDAWITFRGSCYYISDNISCDWTEAIHHCQQHGADLVMIESKDEDLFIRSLLERMYRTPSQHPGQEFWIGANDEMIEGLWVWYKGDKPVNFTGWYPGQPGSEGDEDCAVIASRTDVFNGWHDAPCAASHHPICEIRNTTLIEITNQLGDNCWKTNNQ